MRPEEQRYLANRLAEAELGVIRPRKQGINRSIKTCYRCGKTGLDKTIEIKMPDGTVLHYGTECAGFILQNQSMSMPQEDEVSGDEDESGDEEMDEAEEEEMEEEEEELVPMSRYAPPDYQPYHSQGAPLPPLPHAEDDLSIENFDTRYQIRDVIFDTRTGMGAALNNRDVRRLGFGALMAPSKFLALCPPFDQDPNLLRLEEGMLDPGWGPPFLIIDITDMAVTGHEGRHRSKLFATKYPDQKILVHFFLKGGIQARDVNKDLLKKMDAGLYNQEFYSKLTSQQREDPAQKKKYFVKGPIFSEIFLMRERIKL